MKTIAALFVLLIVSQYVALAAYPPKFPLVGSYYVESRFADQNTPFAAIKAYNDYEAGYVRWDTLVPGADGDLGLSEVSIWDYNANVVYYMSGGECYYENAGDTFPAPYAYDDWTFGGYKMVTTEFVEEWTSSDGLSSLYVDAFTRLPVRTVSNNDTAIISDYSWEKFVEAEMFMVPRNLKCQQVNNSMLATAIVQRFKAGPEDYLNKRALGVGCGVCTTLVGVLVGKGCGIATKAACLLTGPIAPFCGVIMGIICSAACKGADCTGRICRAIRACK